MSDSEHGRYECICVFYLKKISGKSCRYGLVNRWRIFGLFPGERGNGWTLIVNKEMVAIRQEMREGSCWEGANDGCMFGWMTRMWRKIDKIE